MMHYNNALVAAEAKGLVKKFGNNLAVNGVDLCIPAGSIYGVLGPNGAGKTTTIRMLATLLQPDAGTATVFGYDVVKDSHKVRQLIGVTGQYASVDEKLSAHENLLIFSMLHGMPRAQAKKKSAELLEAFALTEAAKRPLQHFSGGMRRRLDLAASLIAQPPLIFLDEPTTGLDPRTRNQMWATIRQMVNNGSAVVLTTQYLEEADQLADRIAVIDHGKVIAEGTPAQLKSRAGAATLELKISDPNQTACVKELLQQMLCTDAHTPAPDTIAAPVNNAAMVTDVLQVLRNEGITVLEISVKPPTLDEVFLTLTGHGTAQPELVSLTI